MSLRIIQIQIVDRVKQISHGELVIDKIVPTICGLGVDGIVYKYDEDEKHWTPITTNKFNPLHKQPKRLQRYLQDDEDDDKKRKEHP